MNTMLHDRLSPSAQRIETALETFGGQKWLVRMLGRLGILPGYPSTAERQQLNWEKMGPYGRLSDVISSASELAASLKDRYSRSVASSTFMFDATPDEQAMIASVKTDLDRKAHRQGVPILPDEVRKIGFGVVCPGAKRLTGQRYHEARELAIFVELDPGCDLVEPVVELIPFSRETIGGVSTNFLAAMEKSARRIYDAVDTIAKQ